MGKCNLIYPFFLFYLLKVHIYIYYLYNESVGDWFCGLVLVEWVLSKCVPFLSVARCTSFIAIAPNIFLLTLKLSYVEGM